MSALYRPYDLLRGPPRNLSGLRYCNRLLGVSKQRLVSTVTFSSMHVRGLPET